MNRPGYLWRSMLYVPGNQPSMLQKCMRYGADAVIVDLEDAISENEKVETRILVNHALDEPMWDAPSGGSDLLVRVNGMQTPYWFEDLQMVVPHKPIALKIPKAERPKEIEELDRSISALEKQHQMSEGTIKLLLTVETAKAFLDLPGLCLSSARVVGIGLGSEDLLTETGMDRQHLDYLRIQLVMVARAFGLLALDCVYPDYRNAEGLWAEAQQARSFGMDGKSAIHPDQIETIHQVFSPSQDQIQWAKKIMQLAEESDGNAFSYQGKMVDKPIMQRARDIMAKWGDRDE